MNELISVLEQGRQFVVQHAPSEVLTRAIPAGILLLIAGIGLSVLGAKLARFGLTAAAVILGGSAGLVFARNNDLHPLLCVLCGAFLVGIIGFQTFRLWVGVGTALVLSAIVVGAFGSREILPHVTEFEQANLGTTAQGEPTFTIPSAEVQQSFADRGPRDWAKEFWSYLNLNHATTARNARAISVVALLIGLCVGLMASRWALILSTSITGTFFVAVGVATLLRPSVPDSVEALKGNPGLAAAGLAGFLITSLILQMLLSRRTETESE